MHCWLINVSDLLLPASCIYYGKGTCLRDKRLKVTGGEKCHLWVIGACDVCTRGLALSDQGRYGPGPSSLYRSHTPPKVTRHDPPPHTHTHTTLRADRQTIVPSLILPFCFTSASRGASCRQWNTEGGGAGGTQWARMCTHVVDWVISFSKNHTGLWNSQRGSLRRGKCQASESLPATWGLLWVSVFFSFVLFSLRNGT